MGTRFTYLIMSLLFGFYQASGQKAIKLFFNQDDQRTTEDSAFYYRVGTQDEKGLLGGEVTDYYAKSKQVKQKATYREGNYHGACASYFENGQLESSGKHEEGQQDGPWKWWYANGKLKEQGSFGQDLSSLVEDYGIARISYTIESFWDSTGKQHVLDGNGEWFDLHSNGHLQTKGKYINGHREGQWLGFYDDDKPYFIEQYWNGTLQAGKSYSKEGTPFTYTVDEAMPEYLEGIGGMNGLMEFIARTTRYPGKALRKGIQGDVYIQFVISPQGKVTNATVAKGVSQALDEEALRVFNLMPVWQPGLRRGQPVPVKYVLPIKFKIVK